MIATVGIPAMAGVVIALFLWGVATIDRRWLPRAAVLLTLWCVVLGALAQAAILSRFDARPPPMALMFVAVLTVSVAVALSKVGTAFRDGIPVAAMLAAQGFRVPLEMVMNRAATDGIMPVEMSFRGYNFEIFTTLFAATIGFIALRRPVPKALLWLAHLGAFATLIAIAVIAMVSSPMVHAFGTDPAHVNTWVTHFPFVYLPAVCVTGALFSHIVITRQLLQKPA